METIEQCLTVKQVLLRAAEIADLATHKDPTLKWPPVGDRHLQSALCLAAYPGPNSKSEAHQEGWWGDHVRIRRMDKEVQSFCKKATGWQHIPGMDFLMPHSRVAEILRQAAGLC